MLIKSSPLTLVEFYIMQSRLLFNPSADNGDTTDFAHQYAIDLDFRLKQPQDGVYLIFTKATINEGEHKSAGHSIYAEGVSVFSIDVNRVTKKEEIKALINFSAVPMAFNNLRSYIADMTSYTPAGRYLLPVFDLNVLLKEKYEKMDLKKRTGKSSKKKEGG